MPDGQLGFEWGEQASDAGPPPEAGQLARHLHTLAGKGIYLGTSSWKYPGWLGRIYSRDRYHTRGKFSQKKFEQECLREYATVCPTVCGDFAFYQFPSPQMWQKTFDQLPEGYHFGLKIPEEVTVDRFADLPRYGQRAGMSNAHFMDADLLQDRLLQPLDPYKSKLGPLIFQFGTMREEALRQPKNFVDRLEHMLSRLPTEEFRFAVEVRNPGFLAGDSGYVDCLRSHKVAHCFNSWTRMPSVQEQMHTTGTFTAHHVVARFLLRPGRTYQQAIDKFAPYERAREMYPDGRLALHELILRCIEEARTLFAFVNNRFEGNALDTIEGGTDDLA